MKALVIGAAGFVGYYLINELKKDSNLEIYASKLPNETIENDCIKVDLDITDFENVKKVMSKIKPDYIYHLAAQSSVSNSWKHPQLTTKINVIGTINILEAIKEYCSNTKVLLVGSSEEYGKIDYSVPVKESTNLNPQNVYAITKQTCEQLGKLYYSAYGLNIYMTRSFNHIGPKQSSKFVISDFCNQVVNIEKGLQEPIIKVGNLASYRDFTDVRDVVKAYTLILKNGSIGEVYNIGSGSSIKISDALELIIK